MSSSDDLRLASAIAERDSTALAEAYQRYGGIVFGLADSVVGTRDYAADIVVEVFLRLWHQPERFDPVGETLRSHLLAEAHKRAVDLVRSGSLPVGRRERLETVEDEGAEARPGPTLAALCEDERLAIQLAYFGGFSCVEIAEFTGKPEAMIKRRIRSGLTRLQPRQR